MSHPGCGFVGSDGLLLASRRKALHPGEREADSGKREHARQLGPALALLWDRPVLQMKAGKTRSIRIPGAATLVRSRLRAFSFALRRRWVTVFLLIVQTGFLSNLIMFE